MKQACVFFVTVLCYTPLESYLGQEGDKDQMVDELANKMTNLEEGVNFLTKDMDNVNSDIAELNDRVSKMESILGSSKCKYEYKTICITQLPRIFK